MTTSRPALDLISFHATRKMLHVGCKKVRALVYSGEISGYDIDGTLRIDRASVVDYLERARIKAPRRKLRSVR